MPWDPATLSSLWSTSHLVKPNLSKQVALQDSKVERSRRVGTLTATGSGRNQVSRNEATRWEDVMQSCGESLQSCGMLLFLNSNFQTWSSIKHQSASCSVGWKLNTDNLLRCHWIFLESSVANLMHFAWRCFALLECLAICCMVLLETRWFMLKLQHLSSWISRAPTQYYISIQYIYI